MNLNLRKIALVTGGSRGLGKVIANNLASLGYELILVAQKIESLEKTRDEIQEEYGTEVNLYSCDLSKKQQVELLEQDLKRKYNTIDVLVNNAGIYRDGSVLSEEDNLEDLLNGNLFSAFYMTRAIIELLENAKNALVVNICSIAGLEPYKNGAQYGISKFAMRGFSLSLREELKNSNTRVTTIYPGAFYSESWKDTELSSNDFMKVEDVAAVVSELTNKSNYTDIEEIILRPIKGNI